MKIKDTQVISPSSVTENDKNDVQFSATKELLSTTEIKAWIVSYVANMLDVNPDEVDVKIPFERYGLDSSAAVGLTGDLEEWLGREIDPTLLYDYPTIEGLVQHLSSELSQG
jgi:acyl carrier protein